MRCFSSVILYLAGSSIISVICPFCHTKSSQLNYPNNSTELHYFYINPESAFFQYVVKNLEDVFFIVLQ